MGCNKEFHFFIFNACAFIVVCNNKSFYTGIPRLTNEVLAATVFIEPVSEQSFIAHFRFPDGSRAEYNISGDELYVDAHILKWKSLANIFGLHTLYELDRVAGRYVKLDDEKNKLRTVHSLSEDKTVDIFELRIKYEFLSFLLDAEYGSATFINVHKASRFKVMVSTSGLLFRVDEDIVN